MKIIINADDFGISPQINCAIIECLKNKICTNTTLMVNMPGCDMAVALAKKHNFQDYIGLHLNLTEGYPLTKEIQNSRTFCDESGKFNCAFHKRTITRLFLKKRDRVLLSNEIEAQIIKFLNLGFNVRHIDSHQHVHTNFSVMIVLYTLLKKYKFETIRISRNLSIRKKMIIHIYKAVFNTLLRYSKLQTTDYFDSMYDFQKSNNKTNQNSYDKILELMIHPMYSSNNELCDTNIPIHTYNIPDNVKIEYINYKQLIILKKQSKL